jgi:hypothetical protein
MIKWLSILGVIVCLVTGKGAEGKEMEKGNPAIRWPSGIEGWKWDGKKTAYNPVTIFEYIDGAGELYRSYNFKRLWVRRYVKENQPGITAELYDMGSSRNAYGIFSYERQDEEVNIGQESEFGGGLLRFWKGQYFVSIYADGEGPEVSPVIVKLAREMDRSIPSKGERPALLDLLPGRDFGLLERSIRLLPNYILLNQRFFVATENILEMNEKTMLILAPYSRQQKKCHLLLLQYPSEKEAVNGVKSFQKTYMPDAGEKDRVQTEDKKWTAVRQYKNFVAIVIGAPAEADALELIQATEKEIKKRGGE